MMFCSLYLCALTVLVFRLIHCNVITLDDDFSKVLSDSNMTKDDIIDKILTKIKSFQVKVHPRIYLYYKLLHKAVWNYARQHGDSFYDPNKYRSNDKTNLRQGVNNVDKNDKENKPKSLSPKIVRVHANKTADHSQEHSSVLREGQPARHRTPQTIGQSPPKEPDARLPDYSDYL